ncbi:MAG: DUF420 domain-containing protein [Polyangiaceae bacterium]
MTTQTAESPRARAAIFGLSAVACLGVALVVYAFPNRATSGHAGVLPTVNAVLNASAAVFLVAGYVMIRRGDRALHRTCMLGALGFSAAFLVTYLLHHAQVGSVPFRGSGAIRVVYFALLVPHIILAAGIVPLALFTVYRAFRGKYELHRKIARVTLPLWLFVSVSGVALYLMLYHWPV